MTIEVIAPDGSRVNFPDGTDAGTINGVMSQHFGIKLFKSWREGGFLREMLRNNSPTAPTSFEKPDGTKVYKRAVLKAMTDKETFLYEDGDVLLPGWKIYAIAGTADKIDVTGLALLGDGE